ncbi:putative DNA modification/repair radical SAM protein [Anaerococcus sp. mt242]|uniref:putative DNA modification/repair radical SAM protein n=1 Tax=Anaerococcus sp. mt242 TaxID=2661917 RepID=UPI0019330DF3|nr:putative DNA modification/repair radical SAM protein [Anaerococcus sp. mt242]MBM0046964.1 putative DNA modification/repair radical SAM protein [Anaerococcus sp. mt242]
MDIREKLEILADAAKYDVSCSSSGSNRKNKNNGLGNGSMGGICHSYSEDGRCISLLKILMTNACIYNCEYCINRRENDTLRATFSPEEVANLTMNFYRRNYIEGLFLSSGIIKNPDYTMERLVKVAEILRYKYNFNGYIHMKAIPGASQDLVKKMGLLVDRMSINIELPSQKALSLLAPEKKIADITRPMGNVKNEMMVYGEDRKKFAHTPKFLPAGQTTQMIIGAGRESDLEIIKTSEKLYNNYALKRVYYSGFVPVVKSKFTQGIDKAPLLREHRLYQADFLMRGYRFKADDLLSSNDANFDLSIDPKSNWAINNIEKFPIEINTASYFELMKVPGFGRTYANRIIEARQFRKLTYDSLRALKISTKRAKHFILVNGVYRGLKFRDKNDLKVLMSAADTKNYQQLSMFDVG